MARAMIDGFFELNYFLHSFRHVGILCNPHVSNVDPDLRRFTHLTPTTRATTCTTTNTPLTPMITIDDDPSPQPLGLEPSPRPREASEELAMDDQLRTDACSQAGREGKGCHVTRFPVEKFGALLCLNWDSQVSCSTVSVASADTVNEQG